MLTSTIITSLFLFLGSTSARVLTRDDSPGPSVTAWAGASGNCQGDTSHTWNLDLSDTSAMCFNYPNSNGAYSPMTSFELNNFPSGKCVSIEMSNDSQCPFGNSQSFSTQNNVQQDGCYVAGDFDGQAQEDANMGGRSFANLQLTWTDC